MGKLKAKMVLLQLFYNNKDKFSPTVIIMSFIYKYLTVELQAGGFYVEVGLRRGLSLSNTLRLDIIYNWKGVLIKSDKESYNTLRPTNRHALTGNFCISPRPYSMYKSENQTSKSGHLVVHDKIECFPLLSVLSAISKKKPIKVDFMSLTTGGTELDIIKTLPKEVAIKMLYIDHRNIKNGFEDIHDYMEHRQYTWVHGVKEDNKVVGSIFVHNLAFSKSF